MNSLLQFQNPWNANSVMKPINLLKYLIISQIQQTGNCKKQEKQEAALKAFATAQLLICSRRTSALWKQQLPLQGRSSARSQAALLGVMPKCSI